MIRTLFALTITALTVIACSHGDQNSLGPAVPTGATEIPGGPMEPTPTVKNPVIPTSQQQAQDTIVRYMQETINRLTQGHKRRRVALRRG